MLSVVVTTRNEAANIVACLRPFAAAVAAGEAETLVVDNDSTDATVALAAGAGAHTFERGPERSAQRNYGYRMAQGDWVLVLDADMILPENTVAEVLAVARGERPGVDAWWIPEIRTGSGFRLKCRNFERSFYNGTAIDALRLFRKAVLEETGGYDEQLIAGPEDWELDIRVLATGAKCAVLAEPLLHNERQLSLRKMLGKKAYYSKSMAAYRAKWPEHPAVKKQFSLTYRYFGVFVENGKWRQLVRHPLLALGMYFERIAVGVVYLLAR